MVHLFSIIPLNLFLISLLHILLQSCQICSRQSRQIGNSVKTENVNRLTSLHHSPFPHVSISSTQHDAFQLISYTDSLIINRVPMRKV